MALINNTTFSPQATEEFYSVALMAGVTPDNIRVVPNVKNSVKLGQFDWGNLFSEDDCTFTDSASGTLATKTLTVCGIKINVDLCMNTLEASYLADKLRPGSNHAELPATFEEYILEQLALKASNQLEYLIWRGDTEASPADVCDGLLKLMLADATVIDVANATLSATNIIAEIGKVYAAIPEAVINNSDLKIFISPAAAKFYALAQAALTGNSTAGYDSAKLMTYLGIPLIISSGMPTNEMVAAVGTNLWMGTDLVTDMESPELIDMKKTTGQRSVRVAAHFKFGVNYGIGAEVVYYN